MKETIKYYYNIDVLNLEEKDGKYFFKYQNQDFFFVFFNRNIEELDDILKCTINMKEKGIDAHNIIVNINAAKYIIIKNSYLPNKKFLTLRNIFFIKRSSVKHMGKLLTLSLFFNTYMVNNLSDRYP